MQLSVQNTAITENMETIKMVQYSVLEKRQTLVRSETTTEELAETFSSSPLCLMNVMWSVYIVLSPIRKQREPIFKIYIFKNNVLYNLMNEILM